MFGGKAPFRLATQKIIFAYQHPESICSKNIKLQESAVIAIYFFRARTYGANLRKFSKVWGRWQKLQRRSPNMFRSKHIYTMLEHVFYVRAWRATTESSTARWVMTIDVRLKI
jgi:hypothetical protein